MRIIHHGGFSEDERRMWKAIIFRNLVDAFLYLLNIMREQNMDLQDQENWVRPLSARLPALTIKQRYQDPPREQAHHWPQRRPAVRVLRLLPGPLGRRQPADGHPAQRRVRALRQPVLVSLPVDLPAHADSVAASWTTGAPTACSGQTTCRTTRTSCTPSRAPSASSRPTSSSRTTRTA